ncbi:MAG TPA: hypothetical protein VHU40_13955 [Polyangia bacterium]|jgi:hypothetical protein|nr:hypothetical protein [Polyangia bacterium]
MRAPTGARVALVYKRDLENLGLSRAQIFENHPGRDEERPRWHQQRAEPWVAAVRVPSPIP